MSIPIVYIAGPFRAPTAWRIAENVRAAERVGLMVARAGAMPLIPHANTAHFHGEGDDQTWIDGTLELLRRCDAAVFIPGWENSKGSVGERGEALRRGMPIHFYDEERIGGGVAVFVVDLVRNARMR